jgi:hypothetical protein
MLTCPICHAELQKNERLTIEHDAIGSLIVRHWVPADVPITSNHDQLRRDVFLSPTQKITTETKMRHTCGSAGFKYVSISRSSF